METQKETGIEAQIEKDVVVDPVTEADNVDLDPERHVLNEDADPEANLVENIGSTSTPRPSLYIHSETPGGSVYWEPIVPDELLPKQGKRFDTMEECIEFYSAYAEKSGFEVKKSTQKRNRSGDVKSKYIMCNRQGVPKDINVNTLDPANSGKQTRNTRYRVTGCEAQIKVDLDYVKRKYEITKFIAKHNHQMLPTEYKHLTKKQRKMTHAERVFVVRASTQLRLGGTKAHTVYSSIKGGAEYVHGTSDDFKNQIRDVNEYIGESDAQMLINKMENRKKFVPGFTFQYKVENSELVAMFWADEVDKRNYEEFGDIISFDATFKTNKYDMVFVPFTGIDNHRKCVNVGSGLLLNEDTEAYTWLLTSFMTAHEKQPTMIVTDQDGAMKRAIEAVLKESKHRLCMWHIMQKIPSKICEEIYDKTNFKERFNKLVWNMFIEPQEFEARWSILIKDFKLEKHKWMTKMYELRKMWLPAYFITSPLFGLMRTTSRSESENAFFKGFTNHGSTLVNFMMCYESAMERQRSKQEHLDFRTFDAAPRYKTMLEMEKHAAKVYTRTIFLLVQTEMYESIWSCQIEEFKKDEGVEMVVVRDTKAGAYRTLFTEEGKEMVVQEEDKVIDYKVLRSLEDGSVECTCRHFMRYGFLCRHVFCVLKNRNVQMIPEKYVLRRWRRDLIPLSLRRSTNRYGEKNKEMEILTNEANYVVDECLFLLSKDKEKLSQFVEKLKTIKKEFEVLVPRPPSQKTADMIEDIYAIQKPNKNIVNNPHVAAIRGAKKGQRRKSAREVAINAKKKQERKCGQCGVKTNKHTKTTCPENPKYIAKVKKIAAAAAAAKEARNATIAAAAEKETRNTTIADALQTGTTGAGAVAAAANAAKNATIAAAAEKEARNTTIGAGAPSIVL